VPIITLLTDFGLSDYYVAAMKGVILDRNPAVHIVDISHEIGSQNILSAAYVLFGAYACFPAGTIHLVVVDPGVGSARRPIVVEAGPHYFVGPDNGVFSFVLRQATNYLAFEITNRSFLGEEISNTFHGRDIFAPIAAALSLGIPLREIGNQLSTVQMLPKTVQVGPSALESRIIHVDRFGNCVTGIERAVLSDDKLPPTFVLYAGGSQIRQQKRFYLEKGAEPNTPFVIWGSAGFLEISLSSSSAAERLELRIGDPVRLLLDAEAIDGSECQRTVTNEHG
jgi:S-adenosyl-L-methionine hydrolase (adenosine-forming)